jgi:hypothetical protein
MAISIIQQQSGSQSAGTSFPLAFAAGVTAGDALIALIALGSASAAVTSISDSKGNLWTKAVGAQAQSRDAEIWFAQNATAGATTVTLNLSASVAAALQLIEASWIFTSVALNRIANISGSSKSPVTGTTATTTQANELAIGFATTGSLTAASAGPTNSYTALTNITTNVSLFGAYQVESVAGARSTGWTLGTGTGWNGVIATFKAAAGVVAATSSETTASGANASAVIAIAPARLDTAITAEANAAKVMNGAVATEAAQSGDSAGLKTSFAAQAADSATGTDVSTIGVYPGSSTADGATAGSLAGSAIQLGSTTSDLVTSSDSLIRSTAFDLQVLDAAGTSDATVAGTAIAAQEIDAAVASGSYTVAVAQNAKCADGSATLESPMGQILVRAVSVEANAPTESPAGLISFDQATAVDIAAAYEFANISANRFVGTSDPAIVSDATSATAILAALALELSTMADAPVAGITAGAEYLDQTQTQDASGAAADADVEGSRIATAMRCKAPIECTMAKSLSPLHSHLVGAMPPIAVTPTSVLSPIECILTQVRQPPAAGMIPAIY